MEFPAWIELLFIILSSVLSVVVAYLGRKIAKEQERRDAMETKINREEQALKDGIKAILRDRLFNICEQCEDRGSLRIEDVENIDEIFKSYEALGGNGAAKKVYTDTIKLPIKAKHPTD